MGRKEVMRVLMKCESLRHTCTPAICEDCSLEPRELWGLPKVQYKSLSGPKMQHWLYLITISNALTWLIWTSLVIWSPVRFSLSCQWTTQRTNQVLLVILFRMCAMAILLSLWCFADWLWPHVDFDSHQQWLSLCYLSPSVAASWALALHMAASEQFICAICSQLGIAAFVGTMSHHNMILSVRQQWR